MDRYIVEQVLSKIDTDNAFIDIDLVISSFGENGQGPSYVRLPFLNSATDCDPLDVEVMLDAGNANGVSVGKTNIAKEVLEAFSDDPEHYRGKALAMAAALRKLADTLELMPAKLADSLTVYELGISSRTANRLEKEGVGLVVDIMRQSEIDLLKMPGIGSAALTDIKKAVARFGGLSARSIRLAAK